MEKIKYVCSCRKVTFDDLENAVNQGCSTVEEVVEKTKASTVCGRCAKDVKEISDHFIKRK